MSLTFWQLVEVWPRRRWNLRKILLHGKGIFLSYRAKWTSPNFNKRTRYLDKLSGEWLFIKGYRWVKNDGNEMLKLYQVIYLESGSQLWSITVWLIVIKRASYEANSYGCKITKHRTKPLHIRHLLPWEFKSRKILRPLQPKRRSAITPQVFV